MSEAVGALEPPLPPDEAFGAPLPPDEAFGAPLPPPEAFGAPFVVVPFCPVLVG